MDISTAFDQNNRLVAELNKLYRYLFARIIHVQALQARTKLTNNGLNIILAQLFLVCINIASRYLPKPVQSNKMMVRVTTG